jgi:hypothetical protein
MSVLDDENILIDNIKESVNNPFYSLFNSFDLSEIDNINSFTEEYIKKIKERSIL